MLPLLRAGRLGAPRVCFLHNTGATMLESDTDARAVTTAARLALDPRGGTHVVHVPIDDERERIAVAQAVARRLARLGFVPIRAGGPVSIEQRHELAHRHLALLTFNAIDDEAALEWLRRLGATSPRAHVVVSFRARHAMEAAPPDVRLRRAQRLDLRGRHAHAERWYRAALASARRRGDEPGQAVACRRLVRLLWQGDHWDAAGRLAESVLHDLREVPARAEVGALLVHQLIACAELGRADAVLSSVSSELEIAGVAVPAALNDARAELRFWQGRLDEVAHIPRAPLSMHRLMVDGAMAFVRRDTAGLVRVRSESGSVGAVAASFCEPLFALLGAALVRDSARVQSFSATVCCRVPAVRCLRLVRLARALMVEAHVLSGLPPPATVLCLRSTGRVPPFDRLFLDWQSAASAGDADRERCTRHDLVRVGSRVVETWRWGCPDMQLVHAIPVLLQIVQDAEDDLAALAAACGWVRREAGAEAVAFLAADRTVVCGAGWTAQDTSDLGVEDAVDRARSVRLAGGGLIVVRSVRYAGATTGLLAIRGHDGRRDTMTEAANTAAALCGPALRARIDLVTTMRASPALTAEILGCSPAIVALREAVARAAVTPFPVLIEGESGTGKELVARAIHRLSPRRDRRFVAVNCAALTDELLEAELFGHARGAFTGAVGARIGLVEDAHGGSLFLDEVSELSARAQAKLLRVLQEREVRRVGENTSRVVDVRVVAATNRPLTEAVRVAAFRADLLFRLAVVRLSVPPLRDRVEDIPPLAHAFWRSLVGQAGKRAVLGPDAIALLCRHAWPGNVRELQNAMAALVVIAPDRGRVGNRHVGQVLSADAGHASSLPLHRARANVERTAVAGALARHGGRRTHAARELGMTRQGLTKAMKRLGLSGDWRTGVA